MNSSSPPNPSASLPATAALLLLGAVSALLPACTNTSHMMLVQDSHLGLLAATSADTQNVGVSFGYRRRFAAVVPKIRFGKEDNERNPRARNAAAVVSASSATYSGPFRVPEISEVVWTGNAAQAIADTPEAKTLVEGTLDPRRTLTKPTPVPSTSSTTSTNPNQ